VFAVFVLLLSPPLHSSDPGFNSTEAPGSGPAVAAGGDAGIPQLPGGVSLPSEQSSVSTAPSQATQPALPFGSDFAVSQPSVVSHAFGSLPSISDAEFIQGHVSSYVEQVIASSNAGSPCDDQQAATSEIVSAIQGKLSSGVCADLEQSAVSCQNASDVCNFASGPRFGGTAKKGITATCPPDKGQIISYCVDHAKSEFEFKQQNSKDQTEADCLKEWEFGKARFAQMCQNADQYLQRLNDRKATCTQEGFIQQCLQQLQSSNYPQPTAYPPHPTTYPNTTSGGTCICNQIYSPVCGADGRTYPNSCYASCAGVLVKWTGSCSAVPSTTPTASATATPAPQPSNAPSNETATPAPSPSVTFTPTETPAPSPTQTPTPEPAPESTQTPVPSPTGNLSQPGWYSGLLIASTVETPSAFVPQPLDPQAKCLNYWNIRQAAIQADCQKMDQGGNGPYGTSDPRAFCSRESFLSACEESRANSSGMGLLEVSTIDFQSICEVESRVILRQMTRYCEQSSNGQEQCQQQVAKKCDYVNRQLSSCKELSDTGKLQGYVSKAVANYCLRAKYVGNTSGLSNPQVDVKKGDEVPVVVLVNASISPDEESALRQAVTSVQGFSTTGSERLYSVRLPASALEGLRSLPFVLDAQFDSVRYSLERRGASGQQSTSSGFKDILLSLEASKSVASSDVKPWLSTEQDKVTNVTDNVDAVKKSDDSKDIGYKLQWFFGLQASREKEEAAKLQAQSDQLNQTIASLQSLAGQVDDLTIRAALNEQISSLQKQEQDLQSLAQQKQGGASGLLSMVGLAK
jgi:hypothetical protein